MINSFGSLQGLVVLDLTNFLAGPYATLIMGDLGANIIKIESMDGDDSRKVPPHSYKKEGAYHLATNRNKKSIVLNLKTSKGWEIFLEMVKKADIVIDNFRVGVIERLQIDYEHLKEVNPRIICCSISGFGKNGPYKDRPAYDMIVQALSGGMSMTGEEGGRPVRSGIPIGDLCAGMFAVIAILSCVHERSISGKGQEIDVSMLDSQISMLCYQAIYYLLAGVVAGPQGAGHVSIPTYRSFPTKNGIDILITANTEKMWQSLCSVLDMEELINDPLFETNKDRLQNKEKLIPLLEERFSYKTCEEWMELLVKGGVPAAPVNTIDKALADPQVLARNMVVDVEHSLGGKIKLLGNPIKLKRTPAETFISPPLHGQHTHEVLRDFLKLDDHKIIALEEEGVVKSGSITT